MRVHTSSQEKSSHIKHIVVFIIEIPHFKYVRDFKILTSEYIKTYFV